MVCLQVKCDVNIIIKQKYEFNFNLEYPASQIVHWEEIWPFNKFSW